VAPTDGRVSFLVDPTMWEERNVLPRAVYGDLDRVVRSDLYYHYATPVCAQRWLDVCEDPAYGHDGLLRRVADVLPGLVEALEEDAGGARRVGLISLGPGDGSVDENVLRGLGARFDVASYCGLDFSFELLRRAVHRIANADGLPSDFPIRAICGDFTDLGSIDALARADADLRLFTLTGFTFGNYSETDLVRRIHALMKEGDYLFLDTRLHGFGKLPEDMSDFRVKNGAAFSSYDLASVRRFVFGPVEVATMARSEEVHVDFDTTRALTTVPDALNLLIYCTGLDTTMRLTGAPVKRDRLDLAVTTMYHFPALVPWFASMGFHVAWHAEEQDLGFFLLKRA
jgi:SAM-dependent methyltransferase